MGSDFTVIMPVRHRFGDFDTTSTERHVEEGDEVEVDSAAPFVGGAEDFPFSCPNVDTSQEAVLQFEHRGSIQRLTFPDPQPDGGLVGITDEHPVFINGQQLSGGVPASPVRWGTMPVWSNRLLLVRAGVLQEENVLRFESTTNASLTGKGLDNFTIDNVVIFYKTRADEGGPGGGPFPDENAPVRG